MKNYYDINAIKYIESTINCDMSEQYEKFLKYLNKNDSILDIGFGSGRDIKKFESLGFICKGIDTSIKFVENMKSQGYDVFLMACEEMNFINEFNGIWACASMLHIKYQNLNKAFYNASKALKFNGIMYASFKYGDFEGYKDGRYFIYLDENKLKSCLENTGLEIVESYISFDVRKDRCDEKWLNVILRKVS